MAARTRFFRYTSDVRPVAWVVLAALLSVLPFLLQLHHELALWEFVGIWFASLYARCRGPYSQHNHGHLAVFGSSTLNTAYDTLLTFITGYPTALWELHHNIGHHRNFLEPENDVASIVDPLTQRPYSRFWYTVRGNLTIHRDSFRIARSEASRGRPKLLRKLWLELAIQAVVLGAFTMWDAKLTVVYLLIPNILAGALVWWESYVHHLGVPATGIYDGSVTTTGKHFNHRNFNIGHHTAHHEKPTLHWSLLPARTDVIAVKVPPVCWRGESPGPGGLVNAVEPVAEERPSGGVALAAE